MLVCWITSHLNAQEVTDLITFKQVDPFLKVLRESNFFPEFTDTVEVAKGENANFPVCCSQWLAFEGSSV